MNSGLSRNRLIWTGSLLIVAASLVALPLVLRPGHQFIGSDDRAVALIASMGTGVQPWMHPIWQPGSASLESLLFGFQAALGLALLTVCFVALRRRQQG